MKKLICFMLAATFALAACGCAKDPTVPSEPPVPSGPSEPAGPSASEPSAPLTPIPLEMDTPAFDLDRYLTPVWEDGGVAVNETAFVLKEKDGSIAPIPLAYPIDAVVSVRDYTLSTKYEEGKDYAIKDGKLVVLPTGRIHALAYDGFYFDEFVQDENWGEADGHGAQLKTESQKGVSMGLPEWQVAVTYTHSAAWQGEIPKDKHEVFPKLAQKLAAGEEVNVVCLGDSISAGWSASGYDQVDLAPHCPKYFDMVIAAMQRKGKVRATNLSVGGMASDWGAAPDQTLRVIQNKPDLLILAFGMNDGPNPANYGMVFKEHLKTAIDAVRKECPDCEIVLVSTMLPNKEVGYGLGSSILQQHEKYPAYMLELEDEYEGVAVADVQSVHKTLLTRKVFRDMSSNNINHPNDYIHRVYAQVVLRTLFGTIKEKENV